jgi:hypothetical protein
MPCDLVLEEDVCKEVNYHNRILQKKEFCNENKFDGSPDNPTWDQVCVRFCCQGNFVLKESGIDSKETETSWGKTIKDT